MTCKYTSYNLTVQYPDVTLLGSVCADVLGALSTIEDSTSLGIKFTLSDSSKPQNTLPATPKVFTSIVCMVKNLLCRQCMSRC